jgi:hypothetical protein
MPVCGVCCAKEVQMALRLRSKPSAAPADLDAAVLLAGHHTGQ